MSIFVWSKSRKAGPRVLAETAYAVYGPGCQDNAKIIRNYYSWPSFKTSRNGTHEYHNQDHCMMTALLTARDMNGGQYYLWKVNTEAKYHREREDRSVSSRRVTPQRI
jgi:hypothetical protein